MSEYKSLDELAQEIQESQDRLKALEVEEANARRAVTSCRNLIDQKRRQLALAVESLVGGRFNETGRR